MLTFCLFPLGFYFSWVLFLFLYVENYTIASALWLPSFVFKKEAQRCSFKALCTGTNCELWGFLIKWFEAEETFCWEIITKCHCLSIFCVEAFRSCSEEFFLHMGCEVGDGFSVFFANFQVMPLCSDAGFTPTFLVASPLQFLFLSQD